MNIVIIGPGALGSLFAVRLTEAKANVTLFDHNSARASALHNQLTLRENQQDRTVSLPITSDPAHLHQAKLILLCVKSGDVRQGLDLTARYGSEQAIVLGFQNGIDHISSIKQRTYAGFGVTAQGATLLRPGHVQHGGNGPTVIGHLSQVNLDLSAIAALFTKAGMPTTVSPNIEAQLWQKLLVNVGINGLTVIHNCPNGELLHIPEARRRLICLVEEGIKVAQALNITLDDDPVQRCLDISKATATNISSMLQDFRKEKPSEIMAINGALVQEAEKLGIACPENNLLIQQVQGIWPKPPPQ